MQTLNGVRGPRMKNPGPLRTQIAKALQIWGGLTTAQLSDRLGREPKTIYRTLVQMTELQEVTRKAIPTGMRRGYIWTLC